MLGIELMLNFNFPYFSTSPSEFWQRWHISLSTWLRDYLYIPLGGNRTGKTYRNLMITMLLGGLWHGAAWNFVLWGLYQGILLCIYRACNGFKALQAYFVKYRVSPLLLSVISTSFFFCLTCYGWLLFRANSFEQILSFTQILLLDVGNLSASFQKPTLSGLAGVPILALYEFCNRFFKNQIDTYSTLFVAPITNGICYAILLILIIMGLSNGPAQFIYFQF